MYIPVDSALSRLSYHLYSGDDPIRYRGKDITIDQLYECARKFGDAPGDASLLRVSYYSDKGWTHGTLASLVLDRAALIVAERNPSTAGIGVACAVRMTMERWFPDITDPTA